MRTSKRMDYCKFLRLYHTRTHNVLSTCISVSRISIFRTYRTLYRTTFLTPCYSLPHSRIGIYYRMFVGSKHILEDISSDKHTHSIWLQNKSPKSWWFAISVSMSVLQSFSLFALEFLTLFDSTFLFSFFFFLLKTAALLLQLGMIIYSMFLFLFIQISLLCSVHADYH